MTIAPATPAPVTPTPPESASRLGNPTPVATSIMLRAAPTSVTGLMDCLIAQVLHAAAGSHVVDPDDGQRWSRVVVLPGGARLSIVLATPNPPRIHAPDTYRISGVVDAAGTATTTDDIERALGALRRMPLTSCEMDDLRAQMPLTVGVGGLVFPAALSQVAPVLVIHHMLDFLVMVEAIISLGVPPELITVLDKGYAYRHTERVDAHLRALGVKVWPWQQAADALADHAKRAGEANRRCLLVDDGGYTLPVLLTELPELVSCFAGLVEQTKSGIFRLAPFGDRIPLPIFSVAESRLKATVESYGVADAATRNVLALLPDEKWEGQPALVVGYGRIGEQVAEILRARRMRVAVFDPDPITLVAAHERALLTARSIGDLLREHRPVLIVGTSGRTSVRGDHLQHLRRDTYLVSVTSRQREIALDEFAETATAQHDLGSVGIRYVLPGGRQVTVLADGYPINFHHAESLPNRYSDLVLAAMILGATTLAQPGHGFQPGHNVARTDAVLAGSGLAERYYGLYGPGRP